jgi:hypothetical protein
LRQGKTNIKVAEKTYYLERKIGGNREARGKERKEKERKGKKRKQKREERRRRQSIIMLLGWS